MDERVTTFAFIGALYLLTHAIGLYTANIYIAEGLQVEIHPQPEISAAIFLLLVLVSTAILVIVLKFFSKRLTQGFFAFILFFGIFAVFEVLIGTPFALLASIGILSYRFLRPSVLSHNLAIILAIAGISAQLGVILNIVSMLLILLALSVYDVIAVFKTKHMIKLAKSLMKKKVPLAIIVPGKVTKKKVHVSQLGTGDIALPLVFSITALSSFGFVQAIAASFGALIGLILAFLLVIKRRAPIPALPPIAGGAILAFLISII